MEGVEVEEERKKTGAFYSYYLGKLNIVPLFSFFFPLLSVFSTSFTI